jgi:hypothetical protein
MKVKRPAVSYIGPFCDNKRESLTLRDFLELDDATDQDEAVVAPTDLVFCLTAGRLRICSFCRFYSTLLTELDDYDFCLQY